MDPVQELLRTLPVDFANVYIALLRLIAPLLMGVILWRAGRPLLSFRKEPEIWAILRLEDDTTLPVTHWENIIGRHPKSDLVIDLPTISKNHAVLTRYDDGSWTITDTESASGVLVNGEQMDICALEPEDEIELGGVKMYLEPITAQQEERLAQLRTRASSAGASTANLLLLTLLQAMCCLAFLLNGDPAHAGDIMLGFCGIFAAQWLVLIFYACIRRSRSRRDQPTKKKVQSPSPMAISCFMASPGTVATMTFMPMVQSRNAMVSISKPERRMQA